MTNLQPYPQPEHQPFRFGDSSRGALLIHGFPGTAAEVRPLGRFLSEHGWRAHGVLLPGFGPQIAQLHTKTRHDWVETAIAEWQNLYALTETRILIGFSMGGALALRVAQQLQPEKLVLIAPFWRLPGFLPKLVPIAKLFMREMRPFQDADFTDPDTRERFRRIMPGLDLDDPVVQERLRTEMTLPMDTIHEVIKLGKEGGRQAPHIRQPTLIIQGKWDDVVQPSITQKLHQRFSEGIADLQQVDGGHDIIQAYAPQRQQVAQLVLNFIDDGVSTT